jgi:RNA-binding protein
MPEITSQPSPALTARQKQFLKALAHPLNPLVQIGKEGMSTAIIDTVNAELLNHELIKVKIGNNSGLDKHVTSQAVAEQTESYLVQLIGKIFVLYKANPEKAKDKRIKLPKG